MIVFKLSMPGIGSWNGKWSGQGRLFARVYRESDVPKKVVGKDFFYRWDDGWEACVSVYKVSWQEGQRIKKESEGFRGYDWMITSIIKTGEIKKPGGNVNVD